MVLTLSLTGMGSPWRAPNLAPVPRLLSAERAASSTISSGVTGTRMRSAMAKIAWLSRLYEGCRSTTMKSKPRRAAVIVEPAHPARISPLLMSAYGLTQREQDVTRLVLQGESTSGIAERLVVTERAVEKHVTSIFGKLRLPATAEDHRRVLAVLTFLKS